MNFPVFSFFSNFIVEIFQFLRIFPFSQFFQIFYQISKFFKFRLNYPNFSEFSKTSPLHSESTLDTYFNLEIFSDNKLLQSQDEDEPGLLEDLKSQICDNIGLYASKYEEEFSPYMKPFVMSVWNLLLSMGPQLKFDMLTSNAIQFLASVADRAQYKNLFEEEATLASICEKIIVPNIEMRTCDVELFEDNPEEYIRRDLEGKKKSNFSCTQDEIDSFLKVLMWTLEEGQLVI